MSGKTEKSRKQGIAKLAMAAALAFAVSAGPLAAFADDVEDTATSAASAVSEASSDASASSASSASASSASADAASQIARIKDDGVALFANAVLSSSETGAVAGDPAAASIVIYSESDQEASTDLSDAATFQSNDTTLRSALQKGSLFYITNTTANIVLSDTDLDFDSDKVKLLVMAGNNAVWGSAGKNGATATFTALDEKLVGDIDVDSISSLDLYLLEGSTWTGASAITANSAGTDKARIITVNIDATSRWVVTANSTVSYLNIADGGSLVDADGKAVTITDADGNKLVDGASDVEVAVTGEFTTTVTTSDVNKLDESLARETDADASDEQVVALKQRITDFFENL